MVWEGIFHGVKTTFVLLVINVSLTPERYRYQPHAIPLIRQRNVTLQQDKAIPHVASVNRDILAF